MAVLTLCQGLFGCAMCDQCESPSFVRVQLSRADTPTVSVDGQPFDCAEIEQLVWSCCGDVAEGAHVVNVSSGTHPPQSVEVMTDPPMDDGFCAPCPGSFYVNVVL